MKINKIFYLWVSFLLFVFITRNGYINSNINGLNYQKIDSSDWRYWDVIDFQVSNYPTRLSFLEVSHEAKMEVRLTLPTLFKMMPFISAAKRPYALLLIEVILFIISINILIKYFKAQGQNIMWVFFMFTTFFGTIFLFDYWPMGDPFAIFFGILLITNRKDWINPIYTFIGLFTDERFLFFILIKIILDCAPLDNRLDKKIFYRIIFMLFTYLLPYFISRTVLTFSHGLRPLLESKTSDVEILLWYNNDHLYATIFALLCWLKGFWVLIISYFGFLCKKHAYVKILFIFLFLSIVVIGSYSVADFSRTLNFGFLIILVPLMEKQFVIKQHLIVLMIFLLVILPDIDYHVPMTMDVKSFYRELIKQNFLVNCGNAMKSIL
jgi:hypothetical protein